MALKRELHQMIKKLEKQGWEVKARRNGHLWLVAPSGVRVPAAASPSCTRGLLNLRSQLRREGAVL